MAFWGSIVFIVFGLSACGLTLQVGYELWQNIRQMDVVEVISGVVLSAMMLAYAVICFNAALQ